MHAIKRNTAAHMAKLERALDNPEHHASDQKLVDFGNLGVRAPRFVEQRITRPYWRSAFFTTASPLISVMRMFPGRYSISPFLEQWQLRCRQVTCAQEEKKLAYPVDAQAAYR